MENKVDRLRGLPEEILHQIFSSFDTKFAVQTCVLSKSWTSFWKSLPFLIFKGDDTHEPFEKFIENVFILHECPNLQSFHLSCNFSKHTNRWILAALKKNVKEIYVHIGQGHLPPLPECLFISNSLTILELKFLDIKHPFCILYLPGLISLPRLKTLVLENLWYLSDGMSKIISGCPDLETLSVIGGDYGKYNFDVSSHSLKHLVIRNNNYLPSSTVDGYNIQIYAPNLLSFCCEGILSQFFLENITVIVKAETEIKLSEEDNYVERMMTFRRVLHNAETLTFLSISIEGLSFPLSIEGVGSDPTQFCKLRHLTLQRCLSRKYITAVPYFLKLFPNVESLHLEIEKEVNLCCSKPELEFPYLDKRVRKEFQEVRVISQCIHYHLKFVEIRQFEGHRNELMFLEVLLKNTMGLEKVVLSAKTQSFRAKKKLLKCIEELLISQKKSSGVKIVLASGSIFLRINSSK